MIYLGVVLALLAAPFWETLAPEEWSDEQIQMILTSSPWVSPQDGAHIYLASARPVREAELERWERRQEEITNIEFPESDEYIEFLLENGGDFIVLAVHIPYPRYLRGEKDTKAMEKRCVLITGKKKHRIVGHFPPTPGDKYLRLVFPRVVPSDSEEILFHLYVPGVPRPHREVIFKTANLTYKGSPEW